MKTNTVDTWERLEESRHNAEQEEADYLSELEEEELKEYYKNPCLECRHKGNKCEECM